MKLTVEVQVVHRTDVRLRLAAEEADAIRLTAVADLRLMPGGRAVSESVNCRRGDTHPYRSTL